MYLGAPMLGAYIFISVYLYKEDRYRYTYIDIAFHSEEAKHTFFSSVHGTVSKIEHMIGHKTGLNKLK